jgi:hypothetical protein
LRYQAQLLLNPPPGPLPGASLAPLKGVGIITSAAPGNVDFAPLAVDPP